MPTLTPHRPHTGSHPPTANPRKTRVGPPQWHTPIPPTANKTHSPIEPRCTPHRGHEVSTEPHTAPPTPPADPRKTRVGSHNSTPPFRPPMTSQRPTEPHCTPNRGVPTSHLSPTALPLPPTQPHAKTRVGSSQFTPPVHPHMTSQHPTEPHCTPNWEVLRSALSPIPLPLPPSLIHAKHAWVPHSSPPRPPSKGPPGPIELQCTPWSGAPDVPTAPMLSMLSPHFPFPPTQPHAKHAWAPTAAPPVPSPNNITAPHRAPLHPKPGGPNITTEPHTAPPAPHAAPTQNTRGPPAPL